MKKIFTLLAALTLVFALAACGSTQKAEEEMSTQESLVTLTYLSGGMLDTSTAGGNMSFATLSNGSGNGGSKVERDIDEINAYMDQLKAFIDNGTKDFADVTEEESDRPEYASKLTFVVNELEYVLYYTIDGEMIEGILIIEDVTYTIVGENDLKDNEKDEAELQAELDELQARLAELQAIETDDEDEQEDIDDEILDIEEKILKIQEEMAEDDVEDVDEEQETKMKIVASNGDDEIEILYKVEESEDEFVTKFEIKEFIGGVETEKEMKMVQEGDHFKIDVEEDGNKLTFKRNVEEDGVVYKLEYRIDGERGQVMIHEVTNEAGEVTYTYKIPGAKEITKGKPESRGRDLDDDDDADDPNEV